LLSAENWFTSTLKPMLERRHLTDTGLQVLVYCVCEEVWCVYVRVRACVRVCVRVQLFVVYQFTTYKTVFISIRTLLPWRQDTQYQCITASYQLTWQYKQKGCNTGIGQVYSGNAYL
jgi:hypothetical protein